jgi:hypothetical protein
VSSLPIDYHVISHSEVSYSSERAKDIAAEYRFQFPGLLSLFEAFRGAAYSWTRPALEDFLLKIVVGEVKLDKSVTWISDQEPDLLIDILWHVGFLRAYAVGGIKALRRSGSQYIGPHQVDTLSLHNIQRFSVHQMFRAGLGMKETRDSPTE